MIVDTKISHMTQHVKVKVRPGEALRLPTKCVHCNKSASERMPVRQKSGQITRFLDLPLCEDCHRDLNRKSGEEERLQRIGLVTATIVGLATMLALFFLLFAEMPIWIRLISALFIAILVFAGIWLVFQRLSSRAVLPETKKVSESAQMIEFSWRATTFAFTNDDFAHRFGQLNQERLMDS